MKNEEERFWFTVGDLINHLKKFPPHMPVVISGQDDGYENFFLPEELEVYQIPYNYYRNGEFQIADENTEEEVFTVLTFTRNRRD